MIAPMTIVRRRRVCAAAAAIWLLCARLLGAQAPASTTAPYEDGGRRDPFVSLVKPKVTSTAKPAISSSRPGAGLGGVAVSDVQVKGVMRSGNSFIALLQGPDGRTFMARASDRLQDGVVAKIERDSVVFTERTADAAGQVRPRDVRKTVRPMTTAGGDL